MKIVNVEKTAMSWDMMNEGWNFEPFPNSFPEDIADLPNNYSYAITITLQLKKGLEISSTTEILRPVACRPFEKPSKQKDYENFLKLNNFLLDK